MFGFGQTADIVCLIIIILVSLFAFIVLVSCVVGECLVKTIRKKVGNFYGENIPTDITIYNKVDKVILKGWFFENKHKHTKETVIFCHGYGQRRDVEPFYEILKGMIDNGYNVLTFDFRRCGESGGKTVTLGIKEVNDLNAVIEFAKVELKQDKIALLGYSMGAVTVLRCGSNPDVSCLIADSPFCDLHNYLLGNLTKWTKLPKFPFSYILLKYFYFRSGYNLKKVDIISDVQKYNDKPLFLIHSKGDSYISFRNSEQIYEVRSKEKTEIWIGENSEHCDMCVDLGDEYIARISKFLRENIN